jgi:hypothetical protein
MPHDYTSLQPGGEKTYNGGMPVNIKVHVQGGGKAQQNEGSVWHLEVPEGNAGSYRLAQLDDYTGLVRSAFPWTAPLKLRLSARASSRTIPGTWGFGLWNDPFGTVFIKGSKLVFPSLPNAAWFFFASPSNYLSLRDDLPANGQLAATFQSTSILPVGLLLRSPLFSLAFYKPIARRLRRWLRQYIRQDAVSIDFDPTFWHEYEIEWRLDRVVFTLQGQVLLETEILPRGPLGLVIWVDNQYAGWFPDGRIGFGTLANCEVSWLQIDLLDLTPA